MLLERFKHIVTKNNLFSQRDKLIIAVSGGVDSVVLCELCKQAGFNFSMAHCNFQLREEESERDERFVKGLGEKYSAEVFVKKFDTEKYAEQNKLSIQEAARNLRYQWFSELLETYRYSSSSSDTRPRDSVFLLTAHHKDDNIETTLMNFFRGTGLHGLTGIPVKNEQIRRPLLEFSKQEIRDFASQNNLEFVEDSSNASNKYTRNLFRNEIIPAIAKVYPQVNENLSNIISRFREIEKLYKLSVGALIDKLCRKKGNEIHIPIKQLMQYNNKALIYEIISKYGFTEKQVDEVIKLAASESGKYLQSSADDYRIIRHRHWFIISPAQSMIADNIVIDSDTSNIQFWQGVLFINKYSEEREPNSKFLITNSSTTALLNLKEIEFPLLLRKYKQGDYFYPLGMKKKKKLSRFFIDQKLSKSDKEKIWVIESAQRIIWIVGHRIDERFKVEENTKNILEIRFSPSK